jgi:hypothetical protein
VYAKYNTAIVNSHVNSCCDFSTVMRGSETPASNDKVPGCAIRTLKYGRSSGLGSAVQHHYTLRKCSVVLLASLQGQYVAGHSSNAYRTRKHKAVPLHAVVALGRKEL